MLLHRHRLHHNGETVPQRDANLHVTYIFNLHEIAVLQCTTKEKQSSLLTVP